MNVKGNGSNGETRIHAIILTKDRPETLQRCVARTLQTLGQYDVVTILDDSLASNCPPKLAFFGHAADFGPAIVHFSFRQTTEAICGSSPSPPPLWLSKTAPRDIAPLRNLSLLLSAAVPAHTTILIDDDIHSFDLITAHNHVRKLARTAPGVIVGTEISGISELDLITRLADAIETLDEMPERGSTASIRELFRVRDSANDRNGFDSRYVSGGYLAFRIPPERLFAFPSGYNEDWLWCLLHGKEGRVRVARSDSAVIHDPPSIRSPTRADVLFELIGDLVFDCLDELQREKDVAPDVALTGVASRSPSLDSMPSTRASYLINKAQRLTEKGYSCCVLNDYGLRILSDMLQAGELEVDGKGVLGQWSDDSIAKQKSFAATLRNEANVSTVRRLFHEGRIS